MGVEKSTEVLHRPTDVELRETQKTPQYTFALIDEKTVLPDEGNNSH